MAYVTESLESLREYALQRARVWLPTVTNLNTGGRLRRLVELAAEVAWRPFDWLNVNLRQVSPRTATGEWMDLWLYSVGLAPKEALAAEGYVVFFRASSAVGSAVPIPAGTLVSTSPLSDGSRVTYVTTEATVMGASNITAAARVRCLATGIVGNVADGAIVERVETIPGVEGVASLPFVTIRLRRASGSTAITIPAGTRIQVDEGDEQVYQTLAAVTLGATETWIDVSCFAEGEYPAGVASLNPARSESVPVGDWTVLSPPSGIAAAAESLAPSTWLLLPGTEEETDEAAQERYRLRWAALSQGGLIETHESWALGVPGVVTARCVRQPYGQGTVAVRVWTQAGAPSAAVLESVRAAIEPYMPLIQVLYVESLTAAPQNVALRVIYDSSLVSTATIQAALLPVLQAHFTYQTTYPEIARLPGGRQWYPSAVQAALMRYLPTGALSVAITSPADNAGTIAADEIPTLGTVTWTYEVASA